MLAEEAIDTRGTLDDGEVVAIGVELDGDGVRVKASVTAVEDVEVEERVLGMAQPESDEG